MSRSSADVHTAVALRLVGGERVVDHTRRLTTTATVRTDVPTDALSEVMSA